MDEFTLIAVFVAGLAPDNDAHLSGDGLFLLKPTAPGLLEGDSIEVPYTAEYYFYRAEI